MKTCYYDLLEVRSDASDLDLKKAYRRKALQYHPDKNPDNVEEATTIFAEIRAAYEVLSDPQERAWYDSHKEQILSDTPLNPNDEDDDYVVDSTVTGVTTEELMMFFNSSLYTSIDNSPAGFYQIAGKVFAKIAKDEVSWGLRLGLDGYKNYKDMEFEEHINSRGYILACDSSKANLSNLLFPIFGYSSTSYEELKLFYTKWSSFNTLKSFTWKDEYMYSRNYDRRTKREINKRNEKARAKAKEEYIKTVKRYVNFIKKLDQRMKEGAKKAAEKRLADERLRKENEMKLRKERLNNEQGAQFHLQSWQTIDQENWKELEKQYEKEFEKRNVDKDDELIGHEFTKNQFQTNNNSQHEDVDEIIIYDCFICKKSFKSEKQLENHIKTKLHKRNLDRVQKEMKKDSMALGLDELSDYNDFDSAESETEKLYSGMDLNDIDAELKKIEEQLAQSSVTDSEDFTDDNNDTEDQNSLVDKLSNTNYDIEIDDEINDDTNEEVQISGADNSETQNAEQDHGSNGDSEEEKEDELTRILRELEESKTSRSNFSDSDEEWSNKKKTKAKKKKNKANTPDKQSITANKNDAKEVCGECRAEFESRNQLFSHIQTEGHVSPLSKDKKGKRSKKNK
ncbi:Zinc finger C2H2 type domain profile [Nakaseomyces glabratus]